MKNMKIGVRLTLIMVSLTAGIIGLSLILNTLFADDYYVSIKQKKLLSEYHTIEEALLVQAELDQDSEKEQVADELQELLASQSDVSGIRTMIIPSEFSDENNGITNMQKGTEYAKETFRYLWIIRWELSNGLTVSEYADEYGISDETETDDSTQTDSETTKADSTTEQKNKGREHSNAVFPWDEDEQQEMLTKLNSDGYYMTELQTKSSGQKDLCLVGYTDSGYLLIMTTSLVNIQESADIANKFILIVGILAILLGSIITYFFANRFTKPIKDMAVAADRMAGLDFDTKVEVTGEDEIGELGRSINTMSDKLEETILDLKQANVELSRDIQNKLEVDEMRKEFISHVSHELKTPIALIQGYAEGLMDGIAEDPESMDFYCEVIHDEASKMNVMVKKLLTLTQLEFGKTEVNIERFDICQLIQNKINASQILFGKKNTKVSFEENGPNYVYADEFMMEEVFGNYLSNALNHVKEDGTIRIWFETRDTDLRVHVFNEGEQIPDEDLEKLWIKFYKVDKARTREYGGSGIGLSIVAATMHAHGKDFGVANVENGVEFYFDLDQTGL